MTENKRRRARLVWFLLILMAAVQLFAAVPAMADDEELGRILPGEWAFEASAGEEEDAGTADLAFLTLAPDGSLSLLCRGRDGETLCTLGGTWSFTFVPEGMDRLTLLFTSTDDPAKAGTEYRLECVYSAYSESWVENDVQHRYLLLEEPVCSGATPFEAYYGESGQAPVGLHREQGPNMRVVKCKNYVSLREKRSASSKRLAKVPLGASVLAFPEAGTEKGFVWCVYQDQYGYILAEYLQPIENGK